MNWLLLQVISLWLSFYWSIPTSQNLVLIHTTLDTDLLRLSMPEYREDLAFFLQMEITLKECILPTGNRVEELWFDRDDGTNEPADFRSACGWVGVLQPDVTRDMPYRQKTSLWPEHLDLSELRTLHLEGVKWNHRGLYFEFKGVNDSPTWMGVNNLYSIYLSPLRLPSPSLLLLCIHLF